MERSSLQKQEEESLREITS